MATPDSQSTSGSNFPTLSRVAPSLSRWLFRSVLLAFGLILLYVLSIGPALQLNKRGIISAETFERIYFPLSLMSGIPGSGWLLDHYMRLWVPEAP